MYMDREPDRPYGGAPIPFGRVSASATNFTVLLAIAFVSFVALAGCGSSSAEVPLTVVPEEGTVVNTDLPDGATGPDTFVVDYDGRTLLEVIGSDSYRLHFEHETASEDGTWEYRFAADIDVNEQANPAENWRHERWFEFDPATDMFAPHTEIVSAKGRLMILDPSIDEWTEIASLLEIPPHLAVPSQYTPVGYSALYGISYLLPRSDWLGNEEIGGVPVGHFEFSSFTEAELEVIGQGLPIEASIEFWIDADGVVRRRQTTTLFEGSHYQIEDTTLFDVGADITIEAPLPPVPTSSAS